MKEKEYVPLYKDLTVQWRPSSSARELGEVVGLATVRNQDGYAIRCYQSDSVVYEFPRDLDKFWHCKEPEKLFFVSGVDRELEPIVKYLGKEACTRLLDGERVATDGLIISYHDNCLSVRQAGGPSLRHIWALKPFYPATMLAEELDCYGVQYLGARLVNTLIENSLPLALTSCGAILGQLTRLPFHNCPAEIAEVAYNCYHGGWIEAVKLGPFDEGFDYDLSSAYPTEAGRLLSCSSSCGSWYHMTEYVQSAEYGFCYCLIRLDSRLPFSPIMVRIRSVMTQSGRYPLRVIRNLVGSWEGWLTKDEIEFIVSNCLGDVEILDGYWFVPDRYHRPFTEIVGKLRQMRNRSEKRGDLLGKNIGKITAASMQGKFMQTYLVDGLRVTGGAFNPVYAATITSRVRLKVAELALENWEDVLMLMVDGILTTRPLGVPKQWKLSHQGKGVVVSHGGYDIEGRETVEKLTESLQESWQDTSYRVRAPRYVSLSEAIESDFFAVAGRVRPEVRARVDQVGKRIWESLPKVCSDLFENQYLSWPLQAPGHKSTLAD